MWEKGVASPARDACQVWRGARHAPRHASAARVRRVVCPARRMFGRHVWCGRCVACSAWRVVLVWCGVCRVVRVVCGVCCVVYVVWCMWCGASGTSVVWCMCHVWRVACGACRVPLVACCLCMTSVHVVRGMMMTACDVSAITKPWQIQKRVGHLSPPRPRRTHAPGRACTCVDTCTHLDIHTRTHPWPCVQTCMHAHTYTQLPT